MIIFNTLNTLQAKSGLIPFIPAGVPNLQITKDILYTFDQTGVNVIELGLPYSDSLADGPIIQNASWKALEKGINFSQVLGLIKDVSPTLKAPIILFAYYNSIISRGILNFVLAIRTAGAKGLAVPDLPLEEADYMIYICSKFCIELVLFITPTSSNVRIETIVKKSPGTIYIISSLGVTGIRQSISSDVQNFVNKIRQKTKKPLILGFGISSLNHIKKVVEWDINGIVVGSAFVSLLSMYGYNSNFLLESIHNFCTDIIAVLKKVDQ